MAVHHKMASSQVHQEEATNAISTAEQVEGEEGTVVEVRQVDMAVDHQVGDTKIEIQNGCAIKPSLHSSLEFNSGTVFLSVVLCRVPSPSRVVQWSREVCISTTRISIYSSSC